MKLILVFAGPPKLLISGTTRHETRSRKVVKFLTTTSLDFFGLGCFGPKHLKTGHFVRSELDDTYAHMIQGQPSENGNAYWLIAAATLNNMAAGTVGMF
jgi:hypothetical protein